MVDYVLKRDENDMVRYLYKNDGNHPYVGLTKIESAEWMLRQGEVKVSEEYDGFPVTANGMYFFEGNCLEDDTPVPTCGPGYCEIPDIEANQHEAMAEEPNNKPKAKKRADKGR